MKESVCAALILALVWAALALLAVQRPQTRSDGAAGPAEQTAAPPPETDSERVPETETESPDSAAEGFDRSFRLQVLRDGAVVSMDLHTYLTGVLLGELPADFAPEAKKAQAVASRTYALHCRETRRHGSAAVCTEPGCCQAWRDPETADPEARAAAERAVSDTDGLAVFYQGALIEAVFFSCSGGRTEDAAAVWGGELPYLQAVDSPGEEEAAYYTDEVRVPIGEFCETLRREEPSAVFPEAKGGWVGGVRYTPGGGVETVELGGVSFAGTRLRKLFGLRSTVFQIRITEDEVIFSTRGYGHRVGMSQYGAQAMAEAGAGFGEILAHYYTGTEVREAAEQEPLP